MVVTLRHLPAATVQEQEGEASRVRRSARSELAGWADSPRSIGRIRSVGAGRRNGLCLYQECTASNCIARRKPEISLTCNNHQDGLRDQRMEKHIRFMILNL